MLITTQCSCYYYLNERCVSALGGFCKERVKGLVIQGQIMRKIGENIYGIV